MEDRTVGLIYALKLNKKYDTDTVIRMFMREWSNCESWNRGSRTDIDKILRKTVADYLATCNNPTEIRRYFIDDPIFITNEFQRMISFLVLAQVKENDMYINGFRDNPYPHYEIFMQE